MKLVFAGLENPIELAVGECTTLEVANSTLFTRVVCSLMSGEGRYAQEPHSIWEGDVELRPKDVLLVVDNPLRLPWDDKYYVNGLLKQMEREYLEDEDLRQAVDEFQRGIESRLLSLTLGMNADVGFGTEWELRRYLKFMGFGVDYQQGKTYPDNLMNFLSLALDTGDKRALVFVNLKTYLSENDFEMFAEQVFYQNAQVLLLENKHDGEVHEHERKRVIDLDFLES